MPLIDFTDKGLYCSAGNFYIDPWRPVDYAVITHGHSDHARWGSKNYLSHEFTKPILQLRLGDNNYQTVRWNERVNFNGVTITLFPAGHIIGSSQIKVEYKGEIWVVSGDYKVENDGISGGYEPVKCHTFITESTFGLPIYNWKPQSEIYADIQTWIKENQEAGKVSVLIAYSLGKAQRVLQAVKEVTNKIFAHGAIYNMQEVLLNANILPEGTLPPITRVTNEINKEEYKGSVIIAPPSAEGTPWMKRFSPYSVGICSGWMQVRGNQRRKNADAGFALSDHCDWKALLRAVEATSAEKVFVTHGFQSAFSRYLNEAGIEAGEVKTEYGTEDEETGSGEEESLSSVVVSNMAERGANNDLANPETAAKPTVEMNKQINISTNGINLFAELVYELGTHTKTTDKLNALVKYFSEANAKDKVWMIALFSGRRPRRTISGSKMAEWCAELVGLPLWLFEESYHTVGDMSETIALLIPDNKDVQKSGRSLSWYIEKFVELEKADESLKKEFILQSWKELNSKERFVFNKLLSSTFRVGVSQSMMVNALAKTVNLESSVIAHRISGNWDPATTPFEELLSNESGIIDHSKPYPFYLAYAIEDNINTLGEPSEWQAEWKWDGIRGQVIKRNGLLFVWSRGEDLITDKFPEYQLLVQKLPDGTVIDGEILPIKNGEVLNFNILQTRIGRKNVTKKQLDEAPAGIFAYDLLEQNGEDIRHLPMEERRQRLIALVADVNVPQLILSPVIQFDSWEELAKQRENSRDHNSEGIMLKRKSSSYQVGRKRGDWWKWKIDPLTIDAVMIYAQKGAGRRSNLYTDYTFAVKDGDKLVSFTKAYSGLTDKEFAQVDNFVKRNSLEKFGPVRTVKPELVFEIAFEGIAASNRHKSGVALRFPRISRWRHDKPASEINTLDDLKKMLEVYGK